VKSGTPYFLKNEPKTNGIQTLTSRLEVEPDARSDLSTLIRAPSARPSRAERSFKPENISGNANFIFRTPTQSQDIWSRRI